MEFEWDESKRESNIRRHSIDFVDLPALFDGLMVMVEDTRVAYGEPRYITIGLLDGRVIVVVHTERKDKIRIFSARKATKYEKATYFEGIANQLGAARRAKRQGH